MVWVRSRRLLQGVHGVVAGHDAIEFEVSGQRSTTLVRVARERHGSDPNAEFDLTITTMTDRDVSESRQIAVAALWDRTIPAGMSCPPGKEAFAEDGTPLADIVPNSVRDFFQKVLAELGGVSLTVARALRWRHGLNVPVKALAHIGQDFSLDRVHWIPIPSSGLSARAWVTVSGIPLYDVIRTELEETLAQTSLVPVGHELLFEAEELANSHERSALVLSLAALEVGAKELVAALVPEAEWLVEHLPSPPLERLIGEYVPTLALRAHLSGTSRMLPRKELIDEIKKAARLRNELVHVGGGNVDGQWLDQWLNLCSSLLYAFDCYAGREWAASRVAQAHVSLIAE